MAAGGSLFSANAGTGLAALERKHRCGRRGPRPDVPGGPTVLKSILFPAVVALTLMTQSLHAQTPTSLEPRRQALKQLLAEEWEYEMRESPETATVYGDYRFNDKLSDISLAHIEQQ